MHRSLLTKRTEQHFFLEDLELLRNESNKRKESRAHVPFTQDLAEPTAQRKQPKIREPSLYTKSCALSFFRIEFALPEECFGSVLSHWLSSFRIEC